MPELIDFKSLSKQRCIDICNKAFETFWQDVGSKMLSYLSKKQCKISKTQIRDVFFELFPTGRLWKYNKGLWGYDVDVNGILNELICKRDQEIYECRFATSLAILSTQMDFVTGDKIERQLPTATSGFQFQTDFVNQLDDKLAREKLNKLLNERERKIMELYQQGHTVREVARITNTPRSTVHDILKYHNL